MLERRGHKTKVWGLRRTLVRSEVCPADDRTFVLKVSATVVNVRYCVSTKYTSFLFVYLFCPSYLLMLMSKEEQCFIVKYKTTTKQKYIYKKGIATKMNDVWTRMCSKCE